MANHFTASLTRKQQQQLLRTKITWRVLELFKEEYSILFSFVPEQFNEFNEPTTNKIPWLVVVVVVVLVANPRDKQEIYK